jgi:hypothetical protein
MPSNPSLPPWSVTLPLIRFSCACIRLREAYGIEKPNKYLEILTAQAKYRTFLIRPEH